MHRVCISSPFFSESSRVQYNVMPKTLLRLVVCVCVAVLAFVVSPFVSSPVFAGTCQDSGNVCTSANSCASEGRSSAEGQCDNNLELCCSASAGSFNQVQRSNVKQLQQLQEAKAAYKEKQALSQEFTTYTGIGQTGASLVDLITGDPNDASSQQASVVGSMSNFMGVIYGNPAASSEVYLADLMHSARLAPPAYAQGLGFASLDPVLSVWKIFRNVAYFFFVIIFLVIGFMIMFRQKISGQTVVTAQQAIPHIIVSLLAVTFSYAIAGLLIDIMYLLMFLLAGLFSSPSDTGYTGEELVTKNIFDIGANILTSGTLGTVHTAMDSFVSGLTRDFLGDIASGGLGWITGIVFAVVFAIALAIGIFRLFFALLRTYIDIIISIAAAPLVLMLGALPGRNTFGGWVKSLFGNLAVFPIVLLVLIIFGKLRDNFSTSTSGFLAPYLIGQGNGGAISTMIGMGFVLIMPDVVQQAKKAFGVTGGIFEVFGQAMTNAIKSGWEGGELVPGLGFTNTKNIPFVGSGKDFARKGAVGAAAVGGGLAGGYNQMWQERMATGSAARGMGSGFTGGARRMIKRTGDKTFENWAKKGEPKDDKKASQGPPKVAP